MIINYKISIKGVGIGWQILELKDYYCVYSEFYVLWENKGNRVFVRMQIQKWK
jgi:hypothetical protein